MEYHGDSFKVNEFKAWINTVDILDKIVLTCNDVQLVRNRILYYAWYYDHEVSTRKIDQQALEVTKI